MNGLKSLHVMVITFGLPWMKLSVQRRVSGAKICLGVLLQLPVMLLYLVLLPLLSITGHISGLEETVQEMQQLKMIVKMTVINKMMSKLMLIKINHYNMNQLMRMNLYQLKRKLLVMVKHFIWMKIRCYRLRASKLVFPISVFCLFRILDDQLAP
jgi:hypothetical protein